MRLKLLKNKELLNFLWRHDHHFQPSEIDFAMNHLHSVPRELSVYMHFSTISNKEIHCKQLEIKKLEVFLVYSEEIRSKSAKNDSGGPFSSLNSSSHIGFFSNWLLPQVVSTLYQRFTQRRPWAAKSANQQTQRPLDSSLEIQAPVPSDLQPAQRSRQLSGAQDQHQLPVSTTRQQHQISISFQFPPPGSSTTSANPQQGNQPTSC